MARDLSYRDRTFTVADPDARVRDPDNLMGYVAAAPGAPNTGGYRIIPKDMVVRVDMVQVKERGAAAPLIFAHALAQDGSELGWTSSRNFIGKFVNETLGAKPPPNNDKKGAHAAWSEGKFRRQLTLVPIVDAKLELCFISQDTLDPYLDLVAAAAADGVSVAINSAFRCYREQEALYEGFIKKLPGYNTAAKPGTSKHQNGVAFDIQVAGGAGDPTYDWLTRNAPQRGFVRTVNKEPWHWEYDPPAAQAALAKGTFKIDRVEI